MISTRLNAFNCYRFATPPPQSIISDYGWYRLFLPLSSPPCSSRCSPLALACRPGPPSLRPLFCLASVLGSLWGLPVPWRPASARVPFSSCSGRSPFLRCLPLSAFLAALPAPCLCSSLLVAVFGLSPFSRPLRFLLVESAWIPFFAIFTSIT